MKLPLLILSLVLLWACSNHKEANSHEHHQQVKTVLSLDNGKKWKTDSGTYNNAALIQGIVRETLQTNEPSLKEYVNTGAQLKKSLDKMISECKMKGKDHDALHLWLEPLITNVSDLQSSRTIEEASGHFHSIHEQVDNFKNYFE